MTDVLQNVSVIIAALTAIWGISAWRRELRGKKEHDLAEEVLALFYEARDAIRAIRSVGGFGEEGKTRQASPEETPDEKQALDRAYVAVERYNTRKEVFNKLWAIRYRFMALFGRDKAGPFDELRAVVNELFVASELLGTYYWQQRARNDVSGVSEREFQEQEQKLRRVCCGSFGPNDEVDQRVEIAVAEMERTCEEVLRSHTPLGIRTFLKAVRKRTSS